MIEPTTKGKLPKSDKEIRKRFTLRLISWFGENAENIEEDVEALMQDLGYVIKPRSLKDTDPVAYRVHLRHYMRAYMAKRRQAERAQQAQEAN